MEIKDLPLVSIIIPCRDEEKYIVRCLDSIIAQNYPKDNLEILVVDGGSTDGTKETVKEYIQKYSFMKLLNNPRRAVPIALNIGIKEVKGEVIMRMDAHNSYEKNYIPKCVKYLKKYDVDNVGGICIASPGANTILARSIALTLSHPFGVGNSYFRIGLKEPRFVDTVPFGCYKKEVFEKIGLFNEELIRNQDIEFNLRLKKAGRKILLIPDIISYYYARSTLRSLAKQNFGNGFWVIYSLKFAKIPFGIRHLVPFFFVLSLMGSLILSFFFHPFIYLFIFILGSYFTLNIFFSAQLCLKNSLKYLPTLILSFSTLHFSYGFGSIWGFIKLSVSKKRRKKD